MFSLSGVTNLSSSYGPSQGTTPKASLEIPNFTLYNLAGYTVTGQLGTFASYRQGGSISVDGISGTLTTASQPNITGLEASLVSSPHLV